MGASFCNLYCKNEHADSLRERLPKESRLLTGYGDWSVLLLQEFTPENSCTWPGSFPVTS